MEFVSAAIRAPRSIRSIPGIKILGFVAFALLPLVAQSATAENSTKAVTQLVQDFTKAQQSFDVPALKELTADDYIEVSPLGEVDPRAKMLGFYSPENKVPAPTVSVGETNARIYADTAIVIAKIGYEMKGPDGQSHTSELRGTFLARHDAKSWKLVSVQYTGIRPAKAQH